MQNLGEIFLVLTVTNFFVSTIGPPISMYLYRHYNNVDLAGLPEFFGRILFWLTVFCTIFVMSSSIIFHRVGSYWQLTYVAASYSHFLVYMYFLILDSVLVAICYLKLDFRSVLTSRFLFFVGSLTIIPCSFSGSPHWMLSFAVGPLLGSFFLMVRMLKGREIVFHRLAATTPRRGAWRDLGGMFVACLSSQVFVYADRWVLASYKIAKEEIAFFTIAVQACTLLMFPIEKLSEMTMPYISMIASRGDFSRKHLAIFVFLSVISMAYVVTFGLLIGYCYIRLFKSAYFAGTWKYFIIFLFGYCFYPMYLFCRGIAIRFFSTSVLVFPYVSVSVFYVLGSTIVMRLFWFPEGIAYIKSLCLALLAGIYVVIFYPLISESRERQEALGDVR